MSDTDSQREILKNIYRMIKNGELDWAREQLQQFLRSNPSNPDALYLTTFLTSDDSRKIAICRRVLEIDPGHSAATKLLKRLTAPVDFPGDLDVENVPPRQNPPQNIDS